MTANNFLDTIVAKRRERLAKEGPELGSKVPAQRIAAHAPFIRAPLAICEIKRKSPSRGNIDVSLDPVAQAKIYYAAGIRSVSVLTEEDHFGGSLEDLMAVKAALPELAVLRKDFLVDERDIDVAYRAGADCVLLIASILPAQLLGNMLKHTQDLGMEALVEVHSEQEISLIRPFRPRLVGINCRDLVSFTMDRLLPLRLRPFIDWPADVVFESGIHSGEHAGFARDHGFSGILVGEAVVRNPAVVPALRAALEPALVEGDKGNVISIQGDFWTRIAGALGKNPTRPLVKICGLARAEDARFAADAGADMLGFIFADSPRRANANLVRELADLKIPKIAVVVARKKGPENHPIIATASGHAQLVDDKTVPAKLPEDVAALLREGLLDAVQFSGDETPQDCTTLGFPYYKALRPKTAGELSDSGFGSPRVLIDAWSPKAYGGTGRVLSPEILEAAKKTGALWMAGGIGPDNVADLILKWRPELLDLSSSLESAPGIKDRARVIKFFKELQHACGSES